MARSPLPRRPVSAALLATLAAPLALLATTLRANDAVLYNHSPSLAVGFYLRINTQPAPGLLVTIDARDAAPGEIDARGLPASPVRFLKRIAAAEGDKVCARGQTIEINGEAVASRLVHGSDGRRLPAWRGCRVLASGELFLMGDTADSFDGRYWGPVPVSAIEGVWRPLLTRPSAPERLSLAPAS